VSDGGDDIASPCEGMSFNPVTGGGVVFNASDGRLYALNPVAGLTWLCVKDGLSTSECTLAISNAFDVRQSVAAEWLCASMEMFKNFGLLETERLKGIRGTRFEPEMAGPRSRAACSGSGVGYQLFDENFCISAPAQLQPVIDSLLTNLRIDSTRQERPKFLQIDIVPSGDVWDIAVGGGLETSCATASVAPELERLIVQAIVPATPHLLTLHAAALQHGGRAFLLAGQSGTGKTTLSLALKRAGWDFASDEIVLMSPDLRLRPLPLPACVKADTFASVETWFPELRKAPEHDRYGKRIKYLPIKSDAFDARVAGFVVFPRYDLGGTNQVQPLDSFLGLQRLLAQCVFVPPSFQHEHVKQLLLWHSKQQYFEIQYTHCEEAIDLLGDLEPNILRTN
jgi:hypothetical protein